MLFDEWVIIKRFNNVEESITQSLFLSIADCAKVSESGITIFLFTITIREILGADLIEETITSELNLDWTLIYNIRNSKNDTVGNEKIKRISKPGVASVRTQQISLDYTGSTYCTGRIYDPVKKEYHEKN